MASTSIQTVPSSFTSALSKPQPKYDVFLNFRGEDTRYKFTDHLYHALVDRKIITFRDDKELKMGEPISQELLEAIEKSRIAVIIFSENYASSTWCLEELAKIVECRDRGILTVLPIFYHVEPTDVRHQKNNFAKAFAKHEKSFEENPTKVQRWRAALTNAANLSGKPIKDGLHEAKFIRSIVPWIYSELKDKLPNDIEDDLVGISSRVEDMISYVEDMISYLHMESTDVHFIGICGMSGMGKTTLARAVFDKILYQFEACSFLENVTEESKAHGIKTLQEQLLCDIGKGGLRVKDECEGMEVISDILRNRKVLIVVDDVSKKRQLETLVGKRDWFGQGSRIIVTTEDEDLLASYEIKIIYKATKLDEDEALQLFRLNAFPKPCTENNLLRIPRCENDFLEYANNIVKCAHGIPLVLKVLGSYLCTRFQKDWESAQSQLRAIFPEETTKKLRIAFDGLGEDEKKLFLDIACFFKGEEKNRVVSAYFSDTSLKYLIDKSLITVVGGKKLWMHPLLQQMGQEIVIVESTVAGGRSRLWLWNDVLDVLKTNTGTRCIESMLLKLPPEEEEEEEKLNAKSFSKMKKLRLLKMGKVSLCCLDYLSNELRLLEWYDCPLKSLPESFHPGELVELIIHRSCIQQLPSEFRNLGKLKLIDLRYSKKLTRTPDFTGFVSIEKLNFQGCTSLHELHPSFVELEHLILLNLKDCKHLKNLPRKLNLKSLKILILSGCSRVKTFPDIGIEMTSLLELYLDGTAIEELPSTIRRLTGLTLLNLQECKNLKRFPSGIHSLTSLESLILSGCKCQPPKAGHLLGLSPIGSSIGATLTFPRLILFLFLSLLAWRYANLRILVFASTVFYCFHNARHPEPEPINLSLSNSFSELSTLVSLDLSDCNLLALPDDLSRLSSIKCLKLSKNYFACLPDRISQLSKLKILFLDRCSKLKSLPCVPLSTQFVSAKGCTSLENYSDQVVVWTSSVAGFTIINCFGLAEDEDGKIAEVSLLDIHPFWQRYVKDQIHKIKGFFHVLPQPEIPEWFKHPKLESFAPISLPSNLFSDENWKGIALCVIFEVPSNSSEISPGQDTKYFHEFYCRLDINEDLIVFKVPKETYVGSFGLWLYISNLRFGKHLNERSQITPVIGANSPDIEIKMRGARILYEQDMEEFLQNLSQKIFGSPSDLCGKLKSLLSSLYQVDWARNHLYDYIFPQIACPPRWFAYQNSSTIKMQLPSNLHDNSRWLGFTIYALYTTQMQRSGFNSDSTISLEYNGLSASEKVSFPSYTAFPLSGDVFDESSLRLVVFYIPRLLFQSNCRCSQIVASFESKDSCVQIEKCGIRLLFRQDVAEFVQALVEYMLGSPDTNHHSFSKNLSHQLRMLQDCNHEKDYCCSFLPERRPTPMPKLLPSNETIQGECTSRETIYSNQVIATGTSKNSSRGSIYSSRISSSLECLEDHHDGLSTFHHSTFNQCLPQSEIPEWFKTENIAERSSSVEIPLPPNFYNNPEWMGFAFCAVFSFEEHLTSVRMKDSGFSFIIVCHLKTNLGCMNPLLWYGINKKDVKISLHQHAFLWVSFIPCGLLPFKWRDCTTVEFSFVSDSTDVSALKCGVDLVYQQKFEFTRAMVQGITSYDGLFTSHGRYSLHLFNQFSGSDGSGGTSRHYSHGCPFQFNKTAGLDFNPSTSYNFCFPPSEIQGWFSHPNHGHSVTIDLPSNLYHDSNWMGLVLYASFSIHGDPNIIFSNLVSGKSHFLYCQCQTSMANVNNQTIAFSTNKEEITWLLNLGEFIWICYVPGEPFKNMLPHCTHIKASFVSNWPGVIVQNCALQLLYQHDQVQFEQELKHCNNLISQQRELVRKQLEDQKKINEQYHVDEGLLRIIFSNIDFEVNIFPRLLDHPETDETETPLGQSDLPGSNKIQSIMLLSPEQTEVSLKYKVFKRMKNLKFLVGNVHIGEALEYLPDELRFLDWREFPLSLSSKSNIILENEVKQGFQYENLKILRLVSCEFITKLLDLCCPNLEELEIKDCKNLIEVDKSIGFLKKLKEWNLENCSQLQILPSLLRLKSLEHFKLSRCKRLEKFPDIHPEMKCVKYLDLFRCGFRELPSSLLYLTGLNPLGLGVSKLTNFLVGANNFSGPIGFQSLTKLDLSGSPKVELDSWMQPDYFPVLRSLSLASTDIVTIPESISRFTTLEMLEIQDCKKLREIPRLPLSIRTVCATNCDRLDTQSSSNLCYQFEGILWFLVNRGAKAATCLDSERPQIGTVCHFELPVTEIPEWLKFNHHQSVGNSVSFLVGPEFSYLFVCIDIPSKDVDNDIVSMCDVDFFINGKKQFTVWNWWAKGNYDHVWLIYGKVDTSEENRIVVEFKGQNIALHRVRIYAKCICCLASSMDQCAFNNGEEDPGRVGIRGRLRRRNHRPTHARRPQKHYLSSFRWLRIRFQLKKRRSKPRRRRITNDDTNAPNPVWVFSGWRRVKYVTIQYNYVFSGTETTTLMPLSQQELFTDPTTVR